MFGKGISDKRLASLALWATVLFFIFGVLYFLPVGIPFKIGFPLTVLSLFSLWLLPWPMSIAIIASAAGDYAGAAGNFVLQMSFFAVAHVFIILFFTGKVWLRFQSFRTEGKLLRRVGYAAAMGTMVILLVIFAMVNVVPEAPEGMLRTGVGCYVTVISLMLYTALLQRSWMYALGAVMFVFSDLILGWNKFVSPVGGQDLLIMIPYYLGQYLLFLRAARIKVRPALLGKFKF